MLSNGVLWWVRPASSWLQEACWPVKQTGNRQSCLLEQVPWEKWRCWRLVSSWVVGKRKATSDRAAREEDLSGSIVCTDFERLEEQCSGWRNQQFRALRLGLLQERREVSMAGTWWGRNYIIHTVAMVDSVPAQVQLCHKLHDIHTTHGALHLPTRNRNPSGQTNFMDLPDLLPQQMPLLNPSWVAQSCSLSC